MNYWNEKHTYEDVALVFSRYIKNLEDREKIHQAYLYAETCHQGQVRASGEPYISHLIEVSYIIATLGGGPSTLVAGFLHDTIEDTGITFEDIASRFGEDVAFLVDSVTKIRRLSRKNDSEFVAEGHRKIFLGMAKDIRVIIIKLADRLHNMRTLQYVRKEKQERIAKETLDVYVPIAHRLGIYKVKAELEDLSLFYLEREKYLYIENLLNDSQGERMKTMISLQKKLADMLMKTNIPFEITSRVKEIYSIYKKMYVKGRKFEEIYDIMALRIITETELNCYEILGLIHSIYKPVPGRFKDYIAMPKPNMYQSLHTTILGNDGNVFEIQIRTKKMDEIAESGVAAHWRYKEGGKYDAKQEQKEIEEQLHWFRDFVSYSDSDQSNEAKEYMDSLTHDIFDANVYVFTPKGRVIELPEGSTPIDFAYKIHSGIGDSMVGAKVNNVLVPLSTKLVTGDIVEIKTSKSSTGPNESWLNLAKTNNAKNHVRKYLIKKNQEFLRTEGIEKGKSILVEAFKENGVHEREIPNYINEKFINSFSHTTLDDFFFGISQKNPAISTVIDKLNLKDSKMSREEIISSYIKRTNSRNQNKGSQAVIVKGANGIKISLAPCCSPLPGDEIRGYITRGQGIKVHRKDCPNIQNEINRTIDVEWNPNFLLSQFPANLIIDSNDRENLLIDVMNVLSTVKVLCSHIAAKLHPDTLTTTISLTIQVSSVSNLNYVIQQLMSINGVYDVKRVIK